MGAESQDRPVAATCTITPPSKKKHVDPASAVIRDHQAFSDFILLANIRWFVRLRWVVVSSLLALALASLTGFPEAMGFRCEWYWPAILAATLGVANFTYRQVHRHLSLADSDALTRNIWTQILLDLVAVTWVVHIAGSVCSFAPFLYVLHITLSCVFLGKRSSMFVLLWSALLYSTCLGLEANGLLTKRNVYGVVVTNWQTTTLIAHAVSAVVVWGTVWYLVGRLSARILDRDRMLVESHRRIRSTFEASRQHMYTTAHQMKSPLAAIGTLIQTFRFLQAEGKDPTPDEYFLKIDQRSRALMDQVRDILQLSNLQAGESVTREFKDVPIGDLINGCIKSFASNAAGRNIEVAADIADFNFFGDADALRIIFENLISNAINYSHEGGTVDITCTPPANERGGIVTIADHGIGIPEDKLPHIFEDYFRTPEAKKHCQLSTGLGLSIVKEAAAFHEITITVSSVQGEGTKFELAFPQHHQDVGQQPSA